MTAMLEWLQPPALGIALHQARERFRAFCHRNRDPIPVGGALKRAYLAPMMLSRLLLAAVLTLGLTSGAFAFCPSQRGGDLTRQVEDATAHMLCLQAELAARVAEQAREAEQQAQINARLAALQLQLRLQQAAIALQSRF